jgi:hypothetical protein
VIVPTVAKFDKEINVVFVVAVIFPAVVAVAALPVVFWFSVGKLVKLAALHVGAK